MSDRPTDRIYVVTTAAETLKVTNDPTQAREWGEKWNVHTKKRENGRDYEHVWNHGRTMEHLEGMQEE